MTARFGTGVELAEAASGISRVCGEEEEEEEEGGHQERQQQQRLLHLPLLLPPIEAATTASEREGLAPGPARGHGARLLLAGIVRAERERNNCLCFCSALKQKRNETTKQELSLSNSFHFF